MLKKIEPILPWVCVWGVILIGAACILAWNFWGFVFWLLLLVACISGAYLQMRDARRPT